jgi:hypothetical protein
VEAALTDEQLVTQNQEASLEENATRGIGESNSGSEIFIANDGSPSSDRYAIISYHDSEP